MLILFMGSHEYIYQFSLAVNSQVPTIQLLNYDDEE